MTDFTELAQRYIDTWNETDADTRARAVADLYSADARYIDPLVVAEGRDAIAATIGAVQQQFPGFTFRLAGAVDAHHDQARFTWELTAPTSQARPVVPDTGSLARSLTPPGAEEALVVGSDVAVRDADGRLSLVLGFLDRVPSPV